MWRSCAAPHQLWLWLSWSACDGGWIFQWHSLLFLHKVQTNTRLKREQGPRDSLQWKLIKQHWVCELYLGFSNNINENQLLLSVISYSSASITEEQHSRVSCIALLSQWVLLLSSCTELTLACSSSNRLSLLLRLGLPFLQYNHDTVKR